MSGKLPNQASQSHEEPANTRQVGGDHYKTGGEEHWDRVHRLGLDYFQGQITKYVERWKKKNGVQDLMKARHFLDKYIELALATKPYLSDIILPGTLVEKTPECGYVVSPPVKGG